MFAKAVFVLFVTVSVLAEAQPPDGYKQIWSDDFRTLSLRTGGPSFAGLEAGKGTWSAPGASYSDDPRGVAGYGYDWFIDPSYNRWPAGYPGPFAITEDGLRIRAQPAPHGVSKILPILTAHPNFARWAAGQVSSINAVQIRPPFYFEARAKMPSKFGRPFPAIWLITGKHPHLHEQSKQYEIDVHEGFADSDMLHSTIHVGRETKFHSVVNAPSGADLSTGFNTWGCEVTKDLQIFYFNNKEVGRFNTPSGADADQFYMIILDTSAGIPWEGGPPSNGPFDMVVRYVKLFAPNTEGLFLKP
jgi:hypothetical protein